MFKEIEDRKVILQPFATPTFYQDFINTPGFLLPPQWYLRLPPRLRNFLEISFYEQSIFQISAAAITFAIYAFLLCVLLLKLLRSYRLSDGQSRRQGLGWTMDNLAWRRVLLLLPIPPITWLCNQFSNNLINFTGPPLIVSTYFFSTFFIFPPAFSYSFYLRPLVAPCPRPLCICAAVAQSCSCAELAI
jgi:MscS family membrane protein